MTLIIVPNLPVFLLSAPRPQPPPTRTLDHVDVRTAHLFIAPISTVVSPVTPASHVDAASIITRHLSRATRDWNCVTIVTRDKSVSNQA